MFNVRTIQEIFDFVRDYFNPPEDAKSVKAIVQVDVRGEGGGEWMVMKHGGSDAR